MTGKKNVLMYRQTKHYLVGAILTSIGFTASLCHFVASKFEDPYEHIFTLVVVLAADVFFFYRAIVPQVLIKLTPEEIWTHREGGFLWEKVNRLAIEERTGYKGSKDLCLIIYLKDPIYDASDGEQIVYKLRELNVRNDELATLLETYL